MNRCVPTRAQHRDEFSAPPQSPQPKLEPTSPSISDDRIRSKLMNVLDSLHLAGEEDQRAVFFWLDELIQRLPDTASVSTMSNSSKSTGRNRVSQVDPPSFKPRVTVPLTQNAELDASDSISSFLQRRKEATKLNTGPTTVQCAGTSKKGVRCLKVIRVVQSDVSVEKYCFWHRPKEGENAPVDPTSVIQCAATTGKGTRCRQRFRTKISDQDVPAEIFCFWHRGSKTIPIDYGRIRCPTTRCSGITKDGKVCRRMAQRVPGSSGLDANTPVFCPQHRDKVMGQTGFYSRNGKAEWVEFSDWIPSYLHPHTQAALRLQMEKPKSSSDVPGYIYVLEIRDPKDTSVVHLKVGRSANLVGRIDEWARQCGSKEQVLRGWWPGTVEDDDNQSSLIKGCINPGEKGACSHRLERLIHLELADLAAHMPYLNEGFPNVASLPDSSRFPVKKEEDVNESPFTVRAAFNGHQSRGRCPDCGTVHKEIFTFARREKGSFKPREWDDIVKPVIKKWGRFVTEHM